MPQLFRVRCPHQQQQGWAAEECYGRGEFPLIASAVGAYQAVGIERQTQALDTPVGNLGKGKKFHWADDGQADAPGTSTGQSCVLRAHPASLRSAAAGPPAGWCAHVFQGEKVTFLVLIFGFTSVASSVLQSPPPHQETACSLPRSAFLTKSPKVSLRIQCTPKPLALTPESPMYKLLVCLTPGKVF